MTAKQEMTVLPKKLNPGDEVRVIAPARSCKIIAAAHRDLIKQRFHELGLRLTFGSHIEECDEFYSSSIRSRVDDLHAAFADPNVKAILTVIGGFNSNQLLNYIDFDLLRKNPKILCGYSDITALQNAILTKSNLVTYSGPHYSTFAIQKKFEFTQNHFVQCFFKTNPFELQPSTHWSDDAWYLDQENREFLTNPGHITLQEGYAEGTIVGGNLSTLQLLQGTPFMPHLNNRILFLEDDALPAASTDVCFDRMFQSLIHQPEFRNVSGIVFGRFQKASLMTIEKLKTIIATKAELSHLPILANIDFGHTDPMITFPIGGTARIEGTASSSKITLLRY